MSTINEEVLAITAKISKLKELADEKIYPVEPSTLYGSVTQLINGYNQSSSDATATASDLILNKTAYVSNNKIVGTLELVSTADDKLADFPTKVTASGINYNVALMNPDNNYAVKEIVIQGPVIGTNTVTPTSQRQTVSPLSGTDYLSYVVVEAVPTSSTYTKDTSTENKVIFKPSEQSSFLNEVSLTAVNSTIQLTPSLTQQTVTAGSSDYITSVSAQVSTTTDFTIENSSSGIIIKTGEAEKFLNSATLEYQYQTVTPSQTTVLSGIDITNKKINNYTIQIATSTSFSLNSSGEQVTITPTDGYLTTGTATVINNEITPSNAVQTIYPVTKSNTTELNKVTVKAVDAGTSFSVSSSNSNIIVEPSGVTYLSSATMPVAEVKGTASGTGSARKITITPTVNGVAINSSAIDISSAELNSGSISITSNKTVDVAGYSTAVVSVPNTCTETATITATESYQKIYDLSSTNKVRYINIGNNNCCDYYRKTCTSGTALKAFYYARYSGASIGNTYYLTVQTPSSNFGIVRVTFQKIQPTQGSAQSGWNPSEGCIDFEDNFIQQCSDGVGMKISLTDTTYSPTSYYSGTLSNGMLKNGTVYFPTLNSGENYLITIVGKYYD